LFTIYLSILQCTNYNHIAIVFPPLPLLDTHNRLFRRPSAAYNSVNPGSFSKWRPAKDVKCRRRTRVQISASEAFAKKTSLRFFVTDFVTTSVTLINCTLVCGNPVCARASLLWPRPAGPPAPSRAAPGISYSLRVYVRYLVFRLHRMHEMQTINLPMITVSVHQSVCLSRMRRMTPHSEAVRRLDTRLRCSGSFGAAFAKSLWSLVISCVEF